MLRWFHSIINWLQRLFNPQPAAPPPPPPSPPTPTQAPTPLLSTAGYQLELNTHSSDQPKYALWGSILTRQEQRFFRALLQAVGDEYFVFAKVRLGDIFKLENEPADRKRYTSQIYCKHFDFLLCDRERYKPILAIELDDATHKKLEHQERDEFKNFICDQARLHLLRFEIAAEYPIGYVKEQIYHRLAEHSGRDA